MTQAKLPSWRPGSTRDAIEIFLDAAEMIPLERRVAVFDIDGTLWCEQPRYLQVDFFAREIRAALAERPELGRRPEYRAILDDDRQAIRRLGPVNVMAALAEFHAGITPEAFEARVLAYFAEARHPDRGVPLSQMRYRPMLGLIAELRARHFSVHVVIGAGIEFVRPISHSFFGVAPEGVVGSQIGYELVHRGGKPHLLRSRELLGDPNEGPAKIANTQRQLGRRPILAAGNSVGDLDMLEYAAAFDGPSLAMLVHHDDAEREYAYPSVAGTIVSDEPMVATARRRGWLVVSMRDDWSTVFADS